MHTEPGGLWLRETQGNQPSTPGVFRFNVPRQLRHLALVLASAGACTAAPAVLPQGGPLQCVFEGTGAEATSPERDPVLGRFWIRETDSDEIAWVDPVTLRRTREDRAALPEQTGLWAVSPHGLWVSTELRRGIRIIDTKRLTSVATIQTDRGPSALAWLSDDLLATVTSGKATLWDARGHQIESFELAPGDRVTTWHSGAGRLIALVAPDVRGGHGAARLLEISGAGMEVVALDRVAAGYDPEMGEHGTLLTPGLAYDPVGQRAFVVPPDGPIAEVDLDGLTVTYHSTETYPVEAVATALVPAASAKLSGSATREAVWLGEGLIAVSGFDNGTFRPDGQPAGVTIIDTRDWSICLLDRRPTRIALTGGTLLAWGGGDFGEQGGVGLMGYALADGRRWHLFGRQYIDVHVYDGYAYAINSWDGWHVSTVDVSSGRILVEREGRPPTVLSTRSSLQGW